MFFPILALAHSAEKCILRSPDDYSATLSPIYSCRSSSIWQQRVTPTSLGVRNYTTKGGYQLAPRNQPPYPRQPTHGQQVTRFQLIHSSLSATAEHFVWAIHRLTSFKFRSLPSSFFVLPSIGSDEHVGMSICEVLWWVNLCVCVCVPVCPRRYLRNHMRDFYQILCMLPMAVARSSSTVVAICYVLPVLWMTSCFFP